MQCNGLVASCPLLVEHVAGRDLELLSECLAAAPHPPPPSVLRLSPLTAVLLVRDPSPVVVVEWRRPFTSIELFYREIRTRMAGIIPI